MAMPAQRRGRSKQDYSTPDVFIAAVKRRLGIEAFECDLAADATNTKAPRYFSLATIDALDPKSHWGHAIGDGWGWLNPPFDRIDPWVERCAATASAGPTKIALLVPASVGANWFLRHVWRHPRAGVLFLNGRLAFIEGKPEELYPKDCMLVLYGSSFTGCDVWTWRRELRAKTAA
jgi:phage N-6-adenine-methyltransferase